MQPRIWLIAGPTASGKSTLALRLAQQIGGEIIGADALQVYRDLHILTARPDSVDEQAVAHHLVGTVDGADLWSVGHWQRAVQKALAALQARGRTAVVVGGTGLYFSALTRGLAEIPPVPVSVRHQAEADFASLGEDLFRERLAGVDPLAASRIETGDQQRLIRAWSVAQATGRALSDWQVSTTPLLAADQWRGVVIEPPRAALYDRCDTRLETMMAAGAVDEVAHLLARDLPSSAPVMKAVGVREIGRYLSGDLSLEAATTLAQQETRRYAKRQSTWLRGQMGDWPRLTATNPDDQWRQFLAANPVLTA